MIISKNPIVYEKNLRDGAIKTGKVKIQVLTYTRDILEKQYYIDVLDTVENTPIQRKTLTKSYAEIDGLRQMLLAQKAYTETGSNLEDALLQAAILMIIQSEKHYDTQTTDWEIYVEPQPVV